METGLGFSVAACLFTGIVATLAGDVWHLLLIKAKLMNPGGWAAVGRWIMGFSEGRIFDPDIKSRPAQRGENKIGWLFHYVVGIGYAAIYLAWLSLGGQAVPGLANCLIFGLITLAAPMLFMKPAMGGGLFGLKSANPARGFAITVTTHAAFGFGLYLGWLLLPGPVQQYLVVL